jgi:hypothetical protein
MHNLTVDTPRPHVMGLLAFRAVGMGLAMMPIMTGGLAVIPPDLVSRASAFNNVVQRSVAALGLAVLTAMLTSQRAQLMADRSARLRPDLVLPAVGPPGAPPILGHYVLYQQIPGRVFVAAIDNLFLVTSWLTLLGVGLALLLRSNIFHRPVDESSGPAGAAPADAPRPELDAASAAH